MTHAESDTPITDRHEYRLLAETLARHQKEGRMPKLTPWYPPGIRPVRK